MPESGSLLLRSTKWIGTDPHVVQPCFRRASMRARIRDKDKLAPFARFWGKRQMPPSPILPERPMLPVAPLSENPGDIVIF